MFGINEVPAGIFPAILTAMGTAVECSASDGEQLLHLSCLLALVFVVLLLARKVCISSDNMQAFSWMTELHASQQMKISKSCPAPRMPC